MEKHYKIYVPFDIAYPMTEILKAGLYAVKQDDGTYGTSPTWAECYFSQGVRRVPIYKHNIWSKVVPGFYAVHPKFKDILDLKYGRSNLMLSEELMLSDIEGLHPNGISVEDYINGDSSNNWGGLESIPEAWHTIMLVRNQVDLTCGADKLVDAIMNCNRYKQ